MRPAERPEVRDFHFLLGNIWQRVGAPGICGHDFADGVVFLKYLPIDHSAGLPKWLNNLFGVGIPEVASQQSAHEVGAIVAILARKKVLQRVGIPKGGRNHREGEHEYAHVSLVSIVNIEIRCESF
jgi:hypothetical protein